MSGSRSDLDTSDSDDSESISDDGEDTGCAFDRLNLDFWEPPEKTHVWILQEHIPNTIPDYLKEYLEVGDLFLNLSGALATHCTTGWKFCFMKLMILIQHVFFWGLTSWFRSLKKGQVINYVSDCILAAQRGNSPYISKHIFSSRWI